MLTMTLMLWVGKKGGLERGSWRRWMTSTMLATETYGTMYDTMTSSRRK